MKHAVGATMGLLLVLGLIPTTNAKQLLSQEQALKEVLGTTKVEEKDKSVSYDQVDQIKKQLKKETGRRIPRQTKLQVRPDLKCFFPKEDDSENIGIIMKEPGKWGPIKFIVALNAKNAVVKDVAVMSYSEKRGRPIARDNFLKQFEGNKIDDAIIVDRDIRGISGATISSWAAALSVRKAQLKYKKAFLSEEEEE